jgi:hypothetical protein
VTIDPDLGKRTVRVCWGPRAETVDGLAARWSATNHALAALDPPLAGWVVTGDDGRARPLTEEDLAPIVAAGLGNPAELGYSFGAGTGTLAFHASAGLAAPIPGLMNVAWVEGPTAAFGDLEAALAALVAAWEPDHGQVFSHAWRQAQRPGHRDPYAGPVTHLSAARARLVPADLDATAHPAPDGGVLLSLIDGGALPGLDRVAATGARLREAGAFAPVPTDRPHWPGADPVER